MRIKHVYRRPLDDGEDLGGAHIDNLIDELAPEVEAPETQQTETAEVKDEAPETAEVKDEQPRDPDTGKFVPKARFDEQLSKERLAREAAERKYAELETRLGQISRSEDVTKLEQTVTEMEQQHSKLLLDGEHEKAAQVMRDIRLTERKIALQESQERISQTAQETREAIKMDMAIERLESSYAALNPSADEYNQELVEEVLGWQTVYMERYRLSPSAALTKAADKVMAAQAPQQAQPEPQKGLAVAKPAATDRKQEQVAKNVAAAAAQPAALKGVGQDNGKMGAGGKIDIEGMSLEDLDALPESMLKQLRGDFVA